MDKEDLNRVPKVALIIGVSGVVGFSLVELLTCSNESSTPWKVYGVARRPCPLWLQCYPITYIECDLLNQEDSSQKLSKLTDVTHVFYVTWTTKDTEDENCVANGNMLRHVLEPLLQHAKALQHVCLQTGIKHYFGSHFSFDKRCQHIPMYYEDMPRLPENTFYYVQEDILHECVQKPIKGKNVTWSIHRPGIILGLSPFSTVNSTYLLAIYASICKYEGIPFTFCGTKLDWETKIEIVDANLVAQQEIWAATHPHAQNQAFNISNNDNVSWKDVWEATAAYFEIEISPIQDTRIYMLDFMKSKVEVWEEIVKKHGLFYTKLSDVFPGFNILDILIERLPCGVSSVKKCKEMGFNKSMKTKESLCFWFKNMQEKRIIP